MPSALKQLIYGLLFATIGLQAFAQPPANLPANQRLDLKGTLQVFIRENLATQSSELEYFLDRGRGNPPVKLIFRDNPPADLRSGIGIAVRGMVRSGKFEVEAANFEGDSGSTGGTSLPQPAASVDQRSAAVVVLNLADVSHSSSDQAAMQDFYFGSQSSMQDMYDKISFGQLQINGSVVAVVNSSRTQAEVCNNPFTFSSEFLNLAEQQNPGFNRNNYRHRIFAIPRNASCGWTGYANVGCGSSCSAFNRWSQDVNTTAHEFGHNLGMAHAGSGGNQYADFSSFMGYSLSYAVRALDGAHHWQMGWYQNLDDQTVTTANASGSYQIAPLQESIPAANAASILKIDVANGDPYFLSTRRAEGYDAGLNSANSAALNGVSIHRYAGSGYGATDLVSQLSNGASYSDSGNNLVITQLSRAADGTVTVNLDLGEGECIQNPPSLSMNPSFATVAADESFVFPVTVSNNDSSTCASSNFVLSSTHGAFDNASLLVPPGGQATANLSVVDDHSASDINFTVSLAAENLSVNGTLTVDTTPPAEVSGLSGFYEKKGKNHRIRLNWTGSTSPDLLGYEVFRDGVSVGSSVQNSYSDSLSGSIASSYVYTVKSIDETGNVSTGASVSIATAGRGDGGGKGGGKKTRQ